MEDREYVPREQLDAALRALYEAQRKVDEDAMVIHSLVAKAAREEDESVSSRIGGTDE